MGKHIESATKVLRYALCMFALAFLAGLLFSACTGEQDPDDSVSEEEDAWILMTVKLPQTSLPSSSRSVQTDAESHISDLRVLIFESGHGGFTFLYQVIGSEIESSESRQRFKALLRSMAAPLKCIVVANAEQAFTGYSPAVGDPELEVRKRLELSFASSGIPGDLPMYGEVTMPNGLVSGNNSITVSMLRAVARVDVVKELLPGTDAFTLTGVYVFRANNRIDVIPGSVSDPESPKVTAPTIPDGASQLNVPVSKEVLTGADSILQIYVPESSAVTSDNQLRGSTVIVIGGRWGGSANDITYYRADIDPDGNGARFGELLRNHRYIFNIVQVSGPGWDNMQDAASNYSSFIRIEVSAWEDFSTELYFGGDYFAISAREITLRYLVNRDNRIDIESTVPYTIQWLDAQGNPQDAGVSQQDVITRNNDFNASIVRDEGDPATVSHLLFSTRHDNHKGNVIEHKLRVIAYTWTLDVTVRQDNTAVYSTLHINVLSGKGTYNNMYPTGYLGTNTTYPESTPLFTYGGLAMRMILEKQFGPSAEIRIGGFSFDQIEDTDAYLNATTTANLATIERIIGLQDIIYLSYHVRISDAVAKLIMAWLNASPHRVLIVGTDSADTNANLLKLLTDDGTWAFDHGSDGFTRGDAYAETGDIFSGPFGDVAVSAQFKRADASNGYMSSQSSSVVTLIKDDHGALVFGVNKSRRIIYNGDANFFLNGPLSNNNGNVTTDLDRLMANTWAWAVEQVIYGND